MKESPAGVPLVSVVTATHNRAERLTALLAGLRAQTLPSREFEVVAVDDGSTDATRAVLEDETRRGELRLTTLRNDEARGPAGARNRGWRIARAPLIAFTDDDCVPTESWLASLVAAAKDRPDAIIAGKTLPNPQEAHKLGPYAKTLSVTRPSPHLETCNVAYPRELLERVGGFEESYPSPAGEDSDLGCRARAAGGKPLFAPEAIVHHAVFDRRAVAALRDALVATDDLQSYKLNPSLRKHLPARVFYGRTHLLLLSAVGGLLLSRHNRACVLLALPYARNVRNRVRETGATTAQAGFFVAFDVIQVAAAIRGALRHRVAII